MVNVRIQPEARFNVLLTEDRPHSAGHWTEQFPRLLQPQGVAAYVARTGREAVDLAAQVEIHAAVIDLNTPLDDEHPAGGPATARMWIVELFHRLPRRPPMVLVHNAAYSDREVSRLIGEALRLGAFSVLPKPVQLERLLDVFQRLVERQYRGAWPGVHET